MPVVASARAGQDHWQEIADTRTLPSFVSKVKTDPCQDTPLLPKLPPDLRVFFVADGALLNVERLWRRFV